MSRLPEGKIYLDPAKWQTMIQCHTETFFLVSQNFFSKDWVRENIFQMFALQISCKKLFLKRLFVSRLGLNSWEDPKIFARRNESMRVNKVALRSERLSDNLTNFFVWTSHDRRRSGNDDKYSNRPPPHNTLRRAAVRWDILAKLECNLNASPGTLVKFKQMASNSNLTTFLTHHFRFD